MRRRSLRLRLLVTFGLGSLALSSLFASLTFFGVQHVLTSNQQQTDLKQSYVDAALVRSTLYTAPLQLANELNSIERATTSNVLVQTHNQWLSKSNGAATNDVSFPIIKTVSDGHATEQTLDVNGQIIFVVGVPIPAVETQFFEVFQLKDLEHTLSLLLLVLGAGALLTTLVGASGGLWVARRAVRPLQRVSNAAVLIANGELSTRLVVDQADLEVQQLTESFNAMVSQLVERLERDARFASDVSHELRSPMTTLVVVEECLSLVEDLLEISQNDAGMTRREFETVAAVELVRQSVRSGAQRHGFVAPPVLVDDNTMSLYVDVDRRRFERVITNLIDNAHRYAAGAVAVRVGFDDENLIVNVDDAGPGVAPEEREQVFQRFFRGRAAHDRGIVRGTGLGLALVREHIESLGGTISVDESPEGGARFQIRLPLHHGAGQ